MVQKKFNLVSQVTSKDTDAKVCSLKNESIELITKIVHNTNEIQDETIVIKLSSNIIASDELLQNFVNGIHLLNSCGANIIIVHDYAGLIGTALASIGFEEKLINGSNVADFRMSQIIEMAVSGYINKKLVSALCTENCNAIGISGKDANLIEAKKVQVTQSRKLDGVIDIGFIGEPILVNPEILASFEEANLVTVISPIAFSRTKSTYLLDVDMTASILASAMTAKHMILMCKLDIVKNGNLEMQTISSSEATRMIHKEAYREVSTTLKAAYNAHESGIENIHLIDENDKEGLLYSIFLTKNSIKFSGY
jgi:acetylglutamate kinase